jgi:hypothetical protein
MILMDACLAGRRRRSEQRRVDDAAPILLPSPRGLGRPGVRERNWIVATVATTNLHVTITGVVRIRREAFVTTFRSRTR